jgi:hypothetical protein
VGIVPGKHQQQNKERERGIESAIRQNEKGEIESEPAYDQNGFTTYVAALQNFPPVPGEQESQ